jgi:hypothetical protein
MMIKNLLISDPIKKSMLIISGIMGIKEIKFTNNKYLILNDNDKIVHIYLPEEIIGKNLSRKKMLQLT